MTRLSAIFLALASISTTITINASLAQGAAIAQRQAPKQAPEAVYYMNNDDAANSVVAIRIEKDGVLTEITTTLTGGKGSVINDSSFHNFNFALLSAGSLRVKGRVSVPLLPLLCLPFGSNFPCGIGGENWW